MVVGRSDEAPAGRLGAWIGRVAGPGRVVGLECPATAGRDAIRNRFAADRVVLAGCVRTGGATTTPGRRFGMVR